jgi:glycerate-2-kinase
MSIFQNYDELIQIEENSKARSDVLDILGAGIDSVLPKNALKDLFENDLVKFPKNVIVLGWGKASFGMVNSFQNNYQGEILGGCVIAQPNKDQLEAEINVSVTKGAHPIPDESSIKSGEKLIEIAQGLDEDDTIVCLISGGGSSMFEVPKEGISLEDLQKVYRLLLQSGADIHEVNSVRRALSASKGGGLAKAAYPARIINIIISDVPGDNLEDISSGPTVMDPFEIRPQDVLEKYGMRNEIDEKILKIIQDYLPINEKYFKIIENHIIADNKKAVSAMMKKAGALGYSTTRFPGNISGEAKTAVSAFMGKSGEMIIGGGETTVTVKGKGHGGRNQEFVLAGLEKVEDGILASIGTDGIDGLTEAAGAIGDEWVVKNAREKGFNIDTFLENNNSNEFFSECEGLIITGPTGTNVADICVYMKNKGSFS